MPSLKLLGKPRKHFKKVAGGYKWYLAGSLNEVYAKGFAREQKEARRQADVAMEEFLENYKLQ